MTTEPGRPNRPQNQSSLCGPAARGYCDRPRNAVQDGGRQYPLFEKQHRPLGKAELTLSNRYEALSHPYLGHLQCETAQLPWNVLWTPEMLGDFDMDSRFHASAPFDRPSVDGPGKVASWSDESWFGMYSDPQSDMTSARLICDAANAELSLPFVSETAAQLLEHDMTCSHSLGSESASGSGVLSAVSPCTACSKSPAPLMQVWDANLSEYPSPSDRGDDRMHPVLCDGGLEMNAVPSLEASREQWPDDVGIPSLFSVWLDDHLSGSSAHYQDEGVLSPAFHERAGIPAPSPITHGMGPQASHPRDYGCGSIDLDSPRLPLEENKSPFAFASWSSTEELNLNQHLSAAAQGATYARNCDSSKDYSPLLSSPTVVPQNVYASADVVPKSSLQFSGHHGHVAPRSWPSRQRVQRTRAQSQPRFAQRADPKDVFLVQSKLAGMSYREIRDRGKFTEAESTLRGRFRTLTKDKENRVRKPEWKEHDVRLLLEGVDHVTRESRLQSTSQPARDPGKGIGRMSKIPWKQVAEFIASNGGSYHFGNATCRKKWDEIHGTRP